MNQFPVLRRIMDYAGSQVSSPHYPLLVAGLAFIDLFIGIIPTDACVISGIFARPGRWFILALSAAFGSILGASLLAIILVYDGHLVLQFFPGFFGSESWLQTQEFLKRHGDLAVGLGVLGPFPLQPMVIVPILGGVSFVSWLISFSTARILKYLLISFLASYAPGVIEKFWKINTKPN